MADLQNFEKLSAATASEESLKDGEVDFSIPNDTSNLKDQGILITGGVSGIGAATAIAVAEAGAYVIVLDMNSTLGSEFEKKHTDRGLQ
jgi:heterodisulfide reductase subunit A-like polyferredoxin